jgi:hypothetical protein
MTGVSDRRRVEQIVRQMVVTFSALSNAEIILLPDIDDLDKLSDPDVHLSWGYEFVGSSQFYTFGLELIVSDQTRMQRTDHDNIEARLFVRIALPDPLEQIFRSQFHNPHFEGVNFQLNALIDMDFYAHDPDWLWGTLHYDMGEFQFDSMTDTMLRHGYSALAAELEVIMPWLEFAEYCAHNARSHEQLVKLQKDFVEVLMHVIKDPSLPTQKLFTLCEIDISFQPAVRLIKRRQFGMSDKNSEKFPF